MTDSENEEYRANVLAGVSAVTIFDTNAYRGLIHGRPASARGRAAKLAEAERSAGVRAFANPWVVVELASHLADAGDRHNTTCAAALAALWVHCRADVGNRESLPMVADAEALLCASLYQQLAPDRGPATDMLVGGVKQVHDDPSPEGMAWLQPTLQQLKAVADKFESHCVSLMQHSFDGYDLSDPAVRRDIGNILATPAALRIAGTQAVMRARRLLGLAGDDPERSHRVRAVCDNFKTATRLYIDKMRHMLNGLDISAPRHRNSVWDVDISYSVGQTIHGGVPLHLVTTDKDIRRNARDAGESAIVPSLDDYLGRMGMRGGGPKDGSGSFGLTYQ